MLYLFSSAGSGTIIQWDMALVRLITLYTHHVLTTSISGPSGETFFTFKFTGPSPLDRASLSLTIWHELQGHRLRPAMLLYTTPSSTSTSALSQMLVTSSTINILGLQFEGLTTKVPSLTTNRSSSSRDSQIPSIHSGWSC